MLSNYDKQYLKVHITIWDEDGHDYYDDDDDDGHVNIAANG